MKTIRFLIVFFMLTECCFAGAIYATLPEKINADEVYVFYSHGLVLEGEDPRPTHPEYGIYEFLEIVETLAKNSDFNLIAYHRPKNADIAEHSDLLVNWVYQLLESGVSAGNITLIGYSRGGLITAYASSKLKKQNINTVLLASCWPGGIESSPSITFGGHFLSIFETTDKARSCKKIANQSPTLLSFDELSVSTNRGHGAFFTPFDEWIGPLKRWIQDKAVKS